MSTRAAVRRFNATLQDRPSFVQKIWRIERARRSRSYLLKVRSGWLAIDVGVRVRSLTRDQAAALKRHTCDGFACGLRKHLRNSVLRRARLHASDRVLYLDFDGRLVLRIDLYGTGQAILRTDEADLLRWGLAPDQDPIQAPQVSLENLQADWAAPVVLDAYQAPKTKQKKKQKSAKQHVQNQQARHAAQAAQHRHKAQEAEAAADYKMAELHFKSARRSEQKARRAMDVKIKVKQPATVKSFPDLHPPEPHTWLAYSKSGLEIVAGRNAEQNERLVRRMQPNDLLFHADLHGAASVILRDGATSAHPLDLEQAADCAVAWSSAWRDSWACKVWYVRQDQIGEAPSGQYRETGSVVTFGGKTWFARREPDRCAGIDLKQKRVLVGPKSVVPPTGRVQLKPRTKLRTVRQRWKRAFGGAFANRAAEHLRL